MSDIDTCNLGLIQNLVVNFLEQTEGIEPGKMRSALTMLLMEVIKAERAACLEAVSSCAVGPNKQIAKLIGLRIKARGLEQE